MSLLCLRDVAENLPHASKSHICVTTQGLSLIDETEQVSSSGVSLRFWNTIKICWHTVYFCLTAWGGLLDLYTEKTALKYVQQMASFISELPEQICLFLVCGTDPEKDSALEMIPSQNWPVSLWFVDINDILH